MRPSSHRVSTRRPSSMPSVSATRRDGGTTGCWLATADTGETLNAAGPGTEIDAVTGVLRFSLESQLQGLGNGLTSPHAGGELVAAGSPTGCAGGSRSD